MTTTAASPPAGSSAQCTTRARAMTDGSITATEVARVLRLEP